MKAVVDEVVDLRELLDVSDLHMASCAREDRSHVACEEPGIIGKVQPNRKLAYACDSE